MRRGVLVKDGSALERLAETDHALFDKTGTLTLGRPEPTGLDAIPADALPVLAALAGCSRHPLSRAIVHALAEVPQAKLDDVREIAGSGLTASWDGSAVSLGRADQGSGTASRFRIGERGNQNDYAVFFAHLPYVKSVTPLPKLSAADREMPDVVIQVDPNTRGLPTARPRAPRGYVPGQLLVKPKPNVSR